MNKKLPVGYKNVPQCKICKLKDAAGESVRGLFEDKVSNGMTIQDAQKWLANEKGIYVSYQACWKHCSRHAGYLKLAPTKSVKRIITQITHQTVESRGVLRKIISMGDKMIDNWWNGITDEPNMPLSERLLIEAIKEEGRRAPKTAIDQQLDDMERLGIEETNAIESLSKNP